VTRDGGVGRQEGHQRRGTGEHRHAMGLEQPEERLGLEAGDGDHGGAHGQARGERDDEARDVAERHDGDHRVAAAQADRDLRLADRRREVRVRQPDALGQARRAARVGQEREVAGIDRAKRARRAAGQRTLGLVEDDDLAHAGGARPALERRRRRQHRGPRVGDLAGQLALGRGRADARHRAAGGHRAEGDDRPLRRVRRPHRQDVAGREPPRAEPGGHRLHAGGQRGVGQRPPARAVNERGPVGHARRGCEHRLGQRRAAGLDRGRRARHDHLVL
jgi:hypothetical protein